jgi:hypothetical protein
MIAHDRPTPAVVRGSLGHLLVGPVRAPFAFSFFFVLRFRGVRGRASGPPGGYRHRWRLPPPLGLGKAGGQGKDKGRGKGKREKGRKKNGIPRTGDVGNMAIPPNAVARASEKCWIDGVYCTVLYCIVRTYSKVLYGMALEVVLDVL